MYISSLLSKELDAQVFLIQDRQIGYFNYENQNRSDDFLPLIKELLSYDIRVLITPVYWYTMSAQMKTFLDRFSDLLKWEKDLANAMKKVSWFVISCGSDDAEVPGFFTPFRLSAEYLDINYLGDLHVWKYNRKPLTKEVHQLIDKVKKIILTNSSGF